MKVLGLLDLPHALCKSFSMNHSTHAKTAETRINSKRLYFLFGSLIAGTDIEKPLHGNLQGGLEKNTRKIIYLFFPLNKTN